MPRRGGNWASWNGGWQSGEWSANAWSGGDEWYAGDAWAGGSAGAYAWAGEGSWAEPSAEGQLEEMAQKAQSIYAELPRDGRKVWKVLQTCIRNALSAGEVHFERSLRAELEVEMGVVDSLKRQAGSQWVLTMGRGTTYHISVRAEVLGSQSSEVLTSLKKAARAVKSTLLQDGASWLRSLVNGDASREDFLEEVEAQQEQDGFNGKGKGKGKDLFEVGDDVQLCPICAKGLHLDTLGGKHMCRIVVTFTCCGKWTSHSGRYNLQEERVMGQRCQRCNEYGWASDDWKLAEDSGAGGVDMQRPHRSELCEACERYGNCRGVFNDPFQITMAVQMQTGVPPEWEPHRGGNLWTTEVDDVVVVLQPHVHVSRA